MKLQVLGVYMASSYREVDLKRWASPPTFLDRLPDKWRPFRRNLRFRIGFGRTAGPYPKVVVEHSEPPRIRGPAHRQVRGASLGESTREAWSEDVGQPAQRLG